MFMAPSRMNENNWASKYIKRIFNRYTNISHEFHKSSKHIQDVFVMWVIVFHFPHIPSVPPNSFHAVYSFSFIAFFTSFQLTFCLPSFVVRHYFQFLFNCQFLFPHSLIWSLDISINYSSYSTVFFCCWQNCFLEVSFFYHPFCYSLNFCSVFSKLIV